MIYVGIDPGKNSSVCVIGTGPIKFKVLEMDEKHVLYASELSKLFPQKPSTYVIEQQWARPGQTAVELATYAFWQLHAYIDTMDVLTQGKKNALITVAPQTWKKALNLKGQTTTERKRASCGLAQKLAPKYGKWLRNHNFAEAYLLAIYGMCKIADVQFDDLPIDLIR